MFYTHACRTLTAVLFALPIVSLADDSPSTEPVLTEAEQRQLGAGWYPLGIQDGWASVSTTALPNGTTGGSNAAMERRVVVTNRAQLVAALAYPD
ncbi:MAG TPA: hypothetical protein VIV63_17475, partial [Steroidobacteraceae bacterium]